MSADADDQMQSHIVALQAENKRLREALEKIGTDAITFRENYVGDFAGMVDGYFYAAQHIARAALERRDE